MRHAVGVVAVALVTTAACGSATGTTFRSGLYGKVTKGPIVPVCRDGVPCDGPAAGLTLIFSRDGASVVRTTTRSDGSYRVGLKPGRYTVRAVPRAIGPPEPHLVRITAERFRRVDFFVDTGIR